MPSTPAGWNAGAWFGSQIGSTLWLAISAAVLAGRSPTVATAVFALFLIPNAVGIVLWRRRSRLTMVAAERYLLAAFWISSMAAIFIIDRAGLWETLRIGEGTNIPATWAYVIVTIAVVWFGGMLQMSSRKHPPASRDSV